jgi:hypothetical protein
MFSIMRKILLTLIVFTLAVAPIAFGHGTAGHGTLSSHNLNHGHSHADDSVKDRDGGDLLESETAACCGTFGGHCVSGLYFADTAALNCPDFQSVIHPATYNQGHRGIDPEAESPPPRA